MLELMAYKINLVKNYVENYMNKKLTQLKLR